MGRSSGDRVGRRGAACCTGDPAGGLGADAALASIAAKPGGRPGRGGSAALRCVRQPLQKVRFSAQARSRRARWSRPRLAFTARTEMVCAQAHHCPASRAGVGALRCVPKNCQTGTSIFSGRKVRSRQALALQPKPGGGWPIRLCTSLSSPSCPWRRGTCPWRPTCMDQHRPWRTPLRERRRTS